MRTMRKDTVFGAGLLTTAILGVSLASVNSISSVFASVDQSALQSVDLHLEECIKALQAGNTESALTHCELSDQELEPLLQKHNWIKATSLFIPNFILFVRT